MQSGTVSVKILPAVTTAGLSHKDSQKLAEKVQAQMQAEFEVLK
jgi:hypothetical protein